MNLENIINYGKFPFAVILQSGKIINTTIEVIKLIDQTTINGYSINPTNENLYFSIKIEKPNAESKFLPISFNFKDYLKLDILKDYNIKNLFNENQIIYENLIFLNIQDIDFNLFLNEDFNILVQASEKKNDEVIIDSSENCTFNCSNVCGYNKEQIINPINTKIDSLTIPTIDEIIRPINTKIDNLTIPTIDEIIRPINTKIDNLTIPTTDEIIRPINTKIDNLTIPTTDEIIRPINTKIDSLTIPTIDEIIRPINTKIDNLTIPTTDEIIRPINTKIDSLTIPTKEEIINPINTKIDSLTIPTKEEIINPINTKIDSLTIPTKEEIINPINTKIDSLTIPAKEEIIRPIKTDLTNVKTEIIAAINNKTFDIDLNRVQIIQEILNNQSQIIHLLNKIDRKI